MVEHRLALFLGEHESLETWDRAGALERETALYRGLRARGVGVSIVSRGGRAELRYAARLGDLHILCNRWSLPDRLYARLIPWLHARALARATVYKANQLVGCEPALAAARHRARPLVVRCRAAGDLPELESVRRSLAAAHGVTVAEAGLRARLLRQYGLPEARLHVIPEPLDLEACRPATSSPMPGRLCALGPLTEEMNWPIVLEACTGLDVELALAGEGPLREPLGACAARLGLRLTLPGRLPPTDRLDLLRSSAVFLCVPRREGMCEGLPTALACGLPVIVAGLPGALELLRHDETALFAGTDAAGLRAAISRLLADDELRADLGAAARRLALERFSLEKVVELELDLISRLGVRRRPQSQPREVPCCP